MRPTDRQRQHEQQVKANLMKFRTGQTGTTKPQVKVKDQVQQKPLSQVLQKVEAMIKEFKNKVSKPVLSPDKNRRK